jgi:hypothetical protein
MKRLLVLISICALSLFYFPIGCDSSGGGGGDGVHTDATSPAPPPAVSPPSPPMPQLVVSSVRDLGVIRTNPMILKRDVGFSARYENQSVWLFGDTRLDSPNAEDRLLLSNSWSSTYDFDPGDGIEGLTEQVDEVGAPREFFPLTEEEKAFNSMNIAEVCEEDSCAAHWCIWPGTILVDEDKDWAYVFYRKIRVQRGTFNFQHVGHSIAVWKGFSEPVERPVFNFYEPFPTLFFAEGAGNGFGSAALVVGENAFVYGCELGEDKLTKPCKLARVPIANILEKDRWSFFDSNGNWSPDLLEATDIFYGNDMMSVFFNPHIDRFMAIYSESMGSTAMLRMADKPEGPWSAPIELFTIDAPENVYGWVYDFIAHPEISPDHGNTVYITYTKKLDQMNSELRLVAVELEMSP